MTAAFGPTILEHFRRPRNRRALALPATSHEAFNPLCGDRVRVEVALADGVVTDAGFTANACAICTASASLLTERVRGVTVAAALALEAADVIDALGSPIPAGRIECAVLPMKAIHRALESQLPLA